MHGRPSPFSPSSTFKRLLSSLIPSVPPTLAPSSLQAPEPPFAFSFRVRRIRMRWMRRTPRVMHDARPSLPVSTPRWVGGVPRGSLAFSDAPPSARVRPPTRLLRSFHPRPLPSSSSYFSSYYISVSAPRAHRRPHPSAVAAIPFSVLSARGDIRRRPSVNRLRSFPPRQSNTMRYSGELRPLKKRTRNVNQTFEKFRIKDISALNNDTFIKNF